MSTVAAREWNRTMKHFAPPPQAIRICITSAKLMKSIIETLAFHRKNRYAVCFKETRKMYSTASKTPSTAASAPHRASLSVNTPVFTSTPRHDSSPRHASAISDAGLSPTCMINFVEGGISSGIAIQKQRNCNKRLESSLPSKKHAGVPGVSQSRYRHS